ncbi:UNVERIFIED_CONTAM: hypothetical protein FKN15_066698 [Acipenser sinensis]
MDYSLTAISLLPAPLLSNIILDRPDAVTSVPPIPRLPGDGPDCSNGGISQFESTPSDPQLRMKVNSQKTHVHASIAST